MRSRTILLAVTLLFAASTLLAATQPVRAPHAMARKKPPKTSRFRSSFQRRPNGAGSSRSSQNCAVSVTVTIIASELLDVQVAALYHRNG